MQQKECLICKKIYFNKNYCRKIQWDKSKFCSRVCLTYGRQILGICNKPKKEMPSKVCKICGVTFFRKPTGGLKLWERRVVCSMSCLKVWDRQNNIGFQKGHSGYINSGNFKKGQKSWNKDIHVGFNDALKRHRESPNYVNHNKGKHITEEQRKKICLARAKQTNIPSRENHWNWRGGISPLRSALYSTYIYKKWRSDVFRRDNFTCQICGKKGGRLVAHHIKSHSQIVRENKILTVEDAKNCPELWNVLNGQTLCDPCHFLTDTFGSKSIKKN